MSTSVIGTVNAEISEYESEVEKQERVGRSWADRCIGCCLTSGISCAQPMALGKSLRVNWVSAGSDGYARAKKS